MLAGDRISDRNRYFVTWLTLFPAVLTALALATVPGLVVLYLLNVRGLALWALAGPIGITLLAGSAVVAGLLQAKYSIWSLVFGTLIVGAALLVGPRSRAASLMVSPCVGGTMTVKARLLRPAWAFICLALAGVVILWRITTIIGSPDNISQTFDDIYHLNSVRYILETGNASSLTVGQLVDPKNPWAMYPAAWHDYAALVAQVSNVTVPEAVNSVNIVICCVMWPAGAVYLVDTVVGSSMTARALTAVGTAGFSQFPFLMMDFGVLYPTLLATALVPPALAVLVRAVDPARRSEGTDHGAWMALALVIPGLALAHPSGILAVLAFGMPWMAWRWLRAFRLARSRGNRQTVLVSVTAAAFSGTFYVVWKYLRPDPAAATWQPHQSLAQAFGEVVTASAMGHPIPLMLALLLACGLYASYKNPRFRLVLAAFVTGGALYVVVSGLWFGRFRGFLTGGWYSDSYRIAALLPIVTLPVVVIGGLWMGSVLTMCAGRYLHRLSRVSSRINGTHFAALVLPVALLVAFFAVTQFRTVGSEIRNAARNFEFRPDSALLSSDERALLQRLPDFVPDGETIIGSPWTGASLVYAYTGHPALLPHTQGTHGPEADIILDRLNQASSDPGVCTALARVNSRYVLDFGRREVHDGRHEYRGLEDLSQAPGFEEVYKVGGAVLYRISACPN
jgi:hypothetical protein